MVSAIGLLPFAYAQADAIPANLFPDPVYVTLQASNAVESLPSGKTFHVPGAHFMAVNRAGTRLLVGSATTPDVYLLDAESGKTLATFDIGRSPQGVAFTPNGRWAIASSAGTGRVVVIDVRTLKLVKSIEVGASPWGIGVAPDGARAYVARETPGGGVAMIDLHTFQKMGNIPVPGIVPHTLDVSADNGILWVRGLNGHVAAVDLRSRKELAVLAVGASHAGISVVPGSRYVVTGGIGGRVVDVIDAHSFKLVKSIDVGEGPHGICASPDGRWLYAGVIGKQSVVVIDAKTLEIVKQVPVAGQMPVWLVSTGGE